MRATFFRNGRGVLMIGLQPDNRTTVTRPAQEADKVEYPTAWARFKAVAEAELNEAASAPRTRKRKA